MSGLWANNSVTQGLVRNVEPQNLRLTPDTQNQNLHYQVSRGYLRTLQKSELKSLFCNLLGMEVRWMGQGCNHWLYWNWLRTNQCKKSWSAGPLEVPQKTQFNLFIQTINSSPYDTVFYLRHPPFPGKSCPDVYSSSLNYYFLQWLLLVSSLPFFFTSSLSKCGASLPEQLALGFSQFS